MKLMCYFIKIFKFLSKILLDLFSADFVIVKKIIIGLLLM